MKYIFILFLSASILANENKYVDYLWYNDRDFGISISITNYQPSVIQISSNLINWSDYWRMDYYRTISNPIRFITLPRGSSTNQLFFRARNFAPPVILQQPSDITYDRGGKYKSLSFSVETSGTDPREYTWFKDGNLYYGQTWATPARTKTIHLPINQYTNSTFQVTIKNADGAIISRIAKLTIYDSSVPLNDLSGQQIEFIIGSGASPFRSHGQYWMYISTNATSFKAEGVNNYPSHNASMEIDYLDDNKTLFRCFDNIYGNIKIAMTWRNWKEGDYLLTSDEVIGGFESGSFKRVTPP